MGLKEQMKKLKRNLPPGGRCFRLYEGEQVSPIFEHPGNLVIALMNSWRPEGMALEDGVEVIPGYERPVNWQAIQEREDKQPGRMEIV